MTQLTQDIQRAFDIVSPSFPIKSMVAKNPLGGFVCYPFDKALKKVSSIFKERSAASPSEK